MRKYKSSEKKVDIYDIGDGLELINVVTKNDTGDIVRVDTFIGSSKRDEYVSVGRAEGLSGAGVIFSYSQYVKQMRDFLPMYLEMYENNLQGKVYTESGSSYRFLQ